MPADLPQVAPLLDRSIYAAFMLNTVAALDANYPRLGISDLLNREGRQTVRAAKRTCTIDGVLKLAFTGSRDLTRSGRPLADLLERRDTARVLETLRIGDEAPTVPVLVVHNRLDDVVPLAPARAASRRLAPVVPRWRDRRLPGRHRSDPPRRSG